MLSNDHSAQPCGCDLGAGHLCEHHKEKFTDWVRVPEPAIGWTRLLGVGGAPTRATTLPKTAAERKQFPIATGFVDYFPDAIAAIAHLSYVGNEQHNPGQPLHWDRSKSKDESDTMLRHFLERGTLDTDGVRHSVKMAWRALAILQKEIESER